MGNIHVRDVDEQVLFRLKNMARDQQISLSELVRDVLGKYVGDDMLFPSMTAFERAIKETQISMDANTDAYNQFIEDNQRFRAFMIDLLTKEELVIDEDTHNME